MINKETLLIENAPSYEDGAKYLKTKFNSNKNRFIERYLKSQLIDLEVNNLPNAKEICDFYYNLWDDVKPFSYAEAFAIENTMFRSEVFSVINVPEMIENLGHERIKVEGISLKNKIYNEFKEQFETIDFEQIYELHKIDGTKLGLEESLYAIKCWCTSTDAEHWLWIDGNMGEQQNPLKSIVSTCKIYKSMIGKIKHIIRQGDVFLFEMLDDSYMPSPDEEIVSLGTNEYFGLLKSQS